MIALAFDGTWDGMLSAVFDVFTRGINHFTEPGQLHLLRPTEPLPLFADEILHVEVTDEKVARVWQGLRRRLPAGPLSALTVSFLSEDAAMDTVTLRYILKIFNSPTAGKERDFSDDDMLEVVRTARRVRSEAHRMLQFVRFQKASDGTYFAMVDPIHNVLPMTLDHFTDRFADQHFILYDRRRGYGYFYDGGEPRLITLPDELSRVASGFLPDDIMAEDERLFQRLWKTYFKAIAIPERKNGRKQRQDMPVRYWRFLTEKH